MANRSLSHSNIVAGPPCPVLNALFFRLQCWSCHYNMDTAGQQVILKIILRLLDVFNYNYIEIDRCTY